MRILPLIPLVFAFFPAFAQEEKDILVSVQLDLAKTDNQKMFDKVQAGAEVHYFVVRRFSASTGFEVWTADEPSFLMGVRYYPTPETFLRLRALVGANDVCLGAGFSKPIAPRINFEAIGDFYFSVDFAIRAGLALKI